MTTTVQLSPAGRTTTPAGVLQVDWRVLDGDLAAVDVVVSDTTGAPAGAVQRLYDGRLVVLDVPGPLSLNAVPRGAAVHAPGVRLQASLVVLQQGTPVAHVVLPERDLSGTASDLQAEVRSLAPGQWEVVAAGERAADADVLPTDPLALAAAYACRRTVGAARLPEAQRRDVVVVLDLSASMLPHLGSGGVRAALALALGLAAVVGQGTSVPVLTSGPEPAALPALTDDGVADYADRIVADRGVGLGGGLSAVVAGPLADAPPTTSVVHVTDGAPADLSSLPTEWQSRWHVLRLVDPRAPRSSVDEPAAPRTATLSATAEAPPEPEALDAVVTALGLDGGRP